MRLGKAGVSGFGPDLFDQPSDIVVTSTGGIPLTVRRNA
jgi:hypothetical protein